MHILLTWHKHISSKTPQSNYPRLFLCWKTTIIGEKNLGYIWNFVASDFFSSWPFWERQLYIFSPQWHHPQAN